VRHRDARKGTRSNHPLVRSGGQVLNSLFLRGAEGNSEMVLKGKAWKFGADLDTDLIIPARYLNTSDPKELAKHCMEDADPEFAGKVSVGDVIVAGNNFGCGSSREHAPIAIKAVGISCVVAASFARIFYRNAFNLGLPILESPEAAEAVKTGDELEVNLATGKITNLSQGSTYQAQPVPPFMQELLAAGGLMPYVMKRLADGGK
jgi:3-isopropylmalate/(R)-2-methylmalate dehydratase small subunit